MNAYDKIYLEKARTALGRMLDYGVYGLQVDLVSFWELFLASPVSGQFEYGDVSVLAGRSGVELALMVTDRKQEYPNPFFSEEKSEEYWVGWALAYFQWKTCLTFSEITEFISVEEVRGMYFPYHEMDICQFCDRMSEIYVLRKKQTNLKRKRVAAGLTQRELASLTGIPIRTIQQYEQGQKDINKARAEYVIALARALACDPLLLLERGMPKTRD